ncbi:MAG: class I SAM-dependent rRNA methyltransferase [Myxococcales bacterium]|nr:class I SAM-dependent rRNA methyltransferase [Myxococcales bacterium]
MSRRPPRRPPASPPDRARASEREGGRRAPSRATPARGTFQLAKALERVVHAGHPWVFRDAVVGEAAPGEITTLLDRRGRFLARGVAEAGPIALRIWTTRDERVDAALVARRAALAAALRDRALPSAKADAPLAARTSAYRLVHGEGDRLPGVVLDVYGADEGRFAVLRTEGALDAGVVLEGISELLRARGVDTLLHKTGRKAEARVELVFGPRPPELLCVREHGMSMLVDLWHGQKTGLFLDHRESRLRVRQLAAGLRVLNLYAYTGGFSIAAGLAGAAEVTTVDVAPGAVALAERSWAANGLDPARHHAVVADVPRYLSGLEVPPPSALDLIIADPPSFAPSEKAKPAALEAYAKLHEACLGRLGEGGLYLAASCSSHVRAADFDETLREGARRARRVVQVLDRWGGAADHPRLLAFPEGDYLDCLLVRVAATSR